MRLVMKSLQMERVTGQNENFLGQLEDQRKERWHLATLDVT